MMSNQHKWHKEIKAWADGEIIQFLDINGKNEWLDCADNSPYWETDDTVYYRIKPQPKEPQYLYVYYGKLSINANGYFFEQQRLSAIESGYIGKIKLEQDDDNE